MKKYFFLLLTTLLTLFACGGSDDNSGDSNTPPTPDPEPIDTPVVTKTAPEQVMELVGFGWNLGNHFDSYDGNNAAANYRITWSKDCPFWDGKTPLAQLYRKLADAGVKTVRIPVTWGPYQNMTDGNYTIDADYMALVKKNVLWAKACGLTVILNSHHDEYWQLAVEGGKTEATNSNLKARITAMWTQIATAFKDEGDYLIMETFNELNNNWQSATLIEQQIMNDWNQTAVNAIRAVGGQNATRWIAVPSYQASPGLALNSNFKLPVDEAKKLIVSVHCYDPYGFTLQEPFQTEVWGHKSGKSTDESDIEKTMKNLKIKFIDKGTPVYIGEMGCSRHTTTKANACRRYYLEYFCRLAHKYGMPCVLWDNGSTGDGPEHHAYFNHANGAWETDGEDLVKMMIKANTSNDSTYTLKSIYDKAP